MSKCRYYPEKSGGTCVRGLGPDIFGHPCNVNDELKCKLAHELRFKGQDQEEGKSVFTKKPVGETKEGKLVALLSGKESFTLEEIIKKTGFSEASARMYVSQGYLDRKEKPYKVVEDKKGKSPVYRYEIKKKKK